LQVQAELTAQAEERRDYTFTYDASRHERLWIMDSLGAFFEMHWFSDVLRLVKGGKEASVYQCGSRPVPRRAATTWPPRSTGRASSAA